MNDHIKQIAARLRGLRDVLELTEQEVAESCNLTVEEYQAMESGTKDISVSALQMILPSAFQSSHLMSSKTETKCLYHTLTPPHPNCKSVSKINPIIKPQEWCVL